MRFRIASSLLVLVTLAACTPGGVQPLTALRVSATSAAGPWLRDAYDCTPPGSALVLAGPDDPDLVLRLTEPRPLSGLAFQVGTDDLLVVTHPMVAVGQLSSSQVEAIFAGQVKNWREVGGADLEVQVWTFAPGVDIQSFFDRTILQGRPVSSLARLAVSSQDMSDSVGSAPGAIGILPRRWKTGNTREVLDFATVPVLALTDETPRGALGELIACLQAGS